MKPVVQNITPGKQGQIGLAQPLPKGQAPGMMNHHTTGSRSPSQSRLSGLARHMGMSLSEMLLTLAGVAVVLGVLMTVTHSVRADNADQQTRQILRSLRQALDQYQLNTKSYPPEPSSVAIHYLQSMPQCEVFLRNLRMKTSLEGFTTIVDGYGRPIRYMQTTPSGQFQPDFISSGPDGRLGDVTSQDPKQQQAVSDNVYGRDVQLPAM